MFERRLKWFTIILAIMALVVIGRLIDIQLLRADHFEAQAARMLTRPAHTLRAPRGGILDRSGQPLVRDVAAWDVSVHFGVLADREEYLRAVARELRRRGAYPSRQPVSEIVAELREQVARMWSRLSELTGVPRETLIARATRIVRRVQRVRDAVAARAGYVQPVAEETQLHAILEGVDDSQAVAIRLELGGAPWLRVVPDSRRLIEGDVAMVHLLGRLGHADRRRIDADPLADDEQRRLRPGDLCGISGVEFAADTLLRGTRGWRVEDFDRNELERVEPAPGRDVHLTIDAALQRRTYELLASAVAASANPSGAAAVVIHVPTREIRAAVSYPSYSIADFQTRYAELRSDARGLPLFPRAFAGQYPPGSICKAVSLVGGLCEGVVTEHTRIHCRGYFRTPDAFRCWIYNQHNGLTHDMSGHPEGQNASDAVRNSCNIYFYTVGDRLGPERLCDWFQRFGLGQRSGAGLPEEAAGIVPHREWLLQRRNRDFEPADPWNWSIGQGEVTITPVQAASVAATIASGRTGPVRLFRQDDAADLSTEAPVETTLDDAALRVLRAGMWRVVNETGGTGDEARLVRRDVELCGKTGSAQASPRAVMFKYTLEWPDGRREEVVAATPEEALAATNDDEVEIVGSRAAEFFPQVLPGEKLPSHAWFIGFTQPARTPRGARPQGDVYAIAVIVEYAGGGGRVAAPLAKSVVELLLPPESPDAP